MPAVFVFLFARILGLVFHDAWTELWCTHDPCYGITALTTFLSHRSSPVVVMSI